MIRIFGNEGERVALDMGTVLGVVEGRRNFVVGGNVVDRQTTYIYVYGEKEPLTVGAPFDEVVQAMEAQSNCVCGE